MNIADLQRSSFAVAEEKGFHKAQEELEPKTLALYLRLLLTIGELSEAAEELRAGRKPTQIYYEYDLTGDPKDRIISDQPFALLKTDGISRAVIRWMSADEARYIETFDGEEVIPGKPAGFPIELADALIRLADLSESCGVSLEEACEIKERYNRTRAHLHGKTA